MTYNPYAPPASIVDDVERTDPSPPLWNPNAAANWSLLFSPAFGACIHMNNWKALGEPEKAASSKRWMIASLVFILGTVCLAVLVPESKAIDGLSRLVGMGILLSWYVVSARPQAQLVKKRYGKSYPRRGWGKPIALAVAAIAGLLILVIAFTFLVEMATGSP